MNRTSPEEITLAQAAAALQWPRDQVDRYVRRWNVVTPAGASGRGGTYLLTLDDLVALLATARMDRLGVPRSVLIGGIQALRERLTREPAWRGWLVIRNDQAALHDREVDLEEIAAGAAVERVDAPHLREELSERLADAPQTVRRGRPRLDSAWVQERLAASDNLGPDDVAPDEAATLTPQPNLPWNTNSRSQS